MNDARPEAPSTQAVIDRLNEIARLVADESMELDAALDLYEEAVDLALRHSAATHEGLESVEAEPTSHEEPREEPTVSETSFPSDENL